MTRFNTKLFLASVASIALSSAIAQAQTLITDTPGQAPSIARGSGNDDVLGGGSGNLHSLLGTGATSIQKVLRSECNTIGDNNAATSGDIQPNFSCTYEEEGSGFGRQQWSNKTNQWTVAGLANDRFQASHVQFAFADSSATASDIATYNSNVASIGGKPIMFPKYALPVAIAYNPVYGVKGGLEMRFNVNKPGNIGGVAVGGLPLSRELYCGIFNGQINNFNDSRFATVNGASLQDLVNDTKARWDADGVPVRLIGRLDRSGTTDIFTRALAAQCSAFGYDNAYKQNAETLPYNRTDASLPDFAGVRKDTGLSPSSTAAEAGKNGVTLVGNEYFVSLKDGFATVSGGLTSRPTTNKGSGRFAVADGSGKVQDAINFAPDYDLGTAKLNGKIGYIASDYIANSPTGSPTLFAAALQETATSVNYNLPKAEFATGAMSTVLPPQSNNNGAYNAAQSGDRGDPLSWYNMLYPTPITGLANPTVGYPITGTTQFLGYTCYKPQNREHIVALLGWETGALTLDSNGASRAGAVQNIITSSNLGLLPPNWARAINETFLQNTSGALGARNLWIKSQTIPGGTENPTCTAVMGM